MLEAAGIDRVVTVDVHNLQAYQNAFSIRSEHLEARNIFVDYFSKLSDQEKITVMSPDTGGAKRAEAFRSALAKTRSEEVPFALMLKHRSKGIVSGSLKVYGDVKDRTVIIVDDMISSGTTLARGAEACLSEGAASVYAVATHRIFTAAANDVLKSGNLAKVIVTNTVVPYSLKPETIKERIVELDVAPLFGEAIARLHHGGSITELLEERPPLAKHA